MVKATPPPDYKIQNLPAFIRPANADTKILPAPPKAYSANATIIADVDPNSPTTISVRQPQLFTQPVQTHESTHIYQLSRNDGFLDNAMDTKNFAGKTAETLLDYDGISGLENAIKQRKTIANFNAEQQAQIVSDYQRLVADALNKGDRKALSRVTAAYHPFVSQLASIPPKGADMTKMTQQDLTPSAPSVPPATVAGMPMVTDPLLGSSVAPKVGQTKRFVNGKIGVWDGHGWRAMQR
jgi:hypothetical protein